MATLQLRLKGNTHLTKSFSVYGDDAELIDLCSTILVPASKQCLSLRSHTDSTLSLMPELTTAQGGMSKMRVKHSLIMQQV